MNDTDKSQEQLIAELVQLRRQVKRLQRPNAEQSRIEQAKQEWEITADSLPQLICLLDTEGRIIRANRTVEHWGLSDVIAVKGQTVPELVHPGQADSYLDAFLQEAWPGLSSGKSRQLEVEDKALKRSFQIQILPLSTETGRQSKAADGYATLILYDITERKQAERLKNEFLVNVSHDLQTPLTSIIGYSEIMLTGMSGELTAEVIENVQAIHESSQQLSDLINQILDLTELETGNLSLVLEDVAIEPLLEQIRAKHTSLLGKKPVDITIEVEPDLPPIKADKMRLSQILNHLMANAVKFTNEGKIKLRSSRNNGWLHVEVTDTGIGISEDNLEEIFDKFRQIDGSLSRSAQGVGLGLAISRHLIQLHGGTIDVRSKMGQGATFTIQLPIEF